jgi:hypothetical protein
MSLTHRISPVALGALLVVWQPVHRPLARGFAYDLTQRSKSVNPMAGTTDVLSLRAHVQTDADGNSRMDILEASATPIWAVGDYAVMTPSGMLVVSPSKKEYLDLGSDFGMGEMWEVMKTSGMNMKVTEGKFAFDSVAGTETIAGRSTEHFRMLRDGTMTMTTPMAGAMDVAFASETDYYVARKDVPSSAAMMGPTSFGGMASSMVSPEVMERMRVAMIAMHGFVMRSVTHSSSTVMGMTVDQTTTTEVLNMQDAEIERASTTPPAGYTKATLAARMHAFSGG